MPDRILDPWMAIRTDGPSQPREMVAHFFKREIAKLPHRAMTEFQYTSSI
jgi:hypothetical protein